MEYTHFVENNMKLTRLYILDLNSYKPEKDKFNITILMYAVVEKNVIMWNQIKQDDDVFYKLVKEDFGDKLTEDEIL